MSNYEQAQAAYDKMVQEALDELQDTAATLVIRTNERDAALARVKELEAFNRHTHAAKVQFMDERDAYRLALIECDRKNVALRQLVAELRDMLDGCFSPYVDHADVDAWLQRRSGLWNRSADLLGEEHQ